MIHEDFFVYIKQKDGSYTVDKSWFIFSNSYSTRTTNKWGKPRLVYYDYDNDGDLDITASHNDVNIFYLFKNNGTGLFNKNTQKILIYWVSRVSGANSDYASVFAIYF